MFAVSTPPVADTRPNIILIYSDDHARAAISAYGSPYIKTPNIDRLAKEGTLYTRHYSTNPLCAPSRAAILTGKYSHINGHKDNTTTFDQSQPTISKMLQSAGYETAVLGKWHLVSNPVGFDEWEVLRGQGLYYEPLFLNSEGEHKEQGYTTELITQKSLAYLKKQHKKPFFLMIGHKAPHRNWIPNTKNLQMFEGTTFPEPPTLRSNYSGLSSAARNAQMRIDTLRPALDLMFDYVPKGMNEQQEDIWKTAFVKQDADYNAALKRSGDLMGVNFQRYMKNYLRCVADVDRGVGDVLDYLDESGLAKNTIVIYSSDQGFFLGENGWYDKRFFYEPSAGTPLLVKVPGQKARKDTRLTADVDLAPTIMSWAGIKPNAMQGTPISSPAKRDRVYAHFYESDDPDHKVAKFVALTTQRHKVICYYELAEWELFDLASDPWETQSVWNAPAKSGVKTEMARKLILEMRTLKENPSLIEKVRELARFGGTE
ncbi:MAG: sulfatase [Fimbriimonadaceae bacterium]